MMSTSGRDHMLSENIWFEWCNSSMFGEGKSDDGQTDRQTNKQTEFPRVDSSPSVEGVESGKQTQSSQ